MVHFALSMARKNLVTFIMGKLKRTAMWCLSLLYKCVLITTRKLIIITISHMNLSLYGTLFLTALWQHYRQSSDLRQKNSLSSNKRVLHCEGEIFKRVINTFLSRGCWEHSNPQRDQSKEEADVIIIILITFDWM